MEASPPALTKVSYDVGTDSSILRRQMVAEIELLALEYDIRKAFPPEVPAAVPSTPRGAFDTVDTREGEKQWS